MKAPWFRLAGLGAVLACCGGSITPAFAATDDLTPSTVQVAKQPDGSFQYLVDGQPQVFVGMGYNPIYRYLSDEERIASYERDFQVLRAAGVNTITGWDADKGYEQDKFDELTLSVAQEQGIGVIMPLNLPPEGDYGNPAFVQSLMDEAREKIARFKYLPALRMWGVGNEVFWEMPPEMYPAFQQAYVQIADLFHELDPNHPVIYREAEDRYVSEFGAMARAGDKERPWLQLGMNIYNKDPKGVLARWPSHGLDRPVFVSEFGAEGSTPDGRAVAYADMWKGIRCFPNFVLGGAPYAWTLAGPEPTDMTWGLMDSEMEPLDGTFSALSQLWLSPGAGSGDPRCQSGAESPALLPASAPIVRRVQSVAVSSSAAAAVAPGPAPAPKASQAPAPAPSPKQASSTTTSRTSSTARTTTRKHH